MCVCVWVITEEVTELMKEFRAGEEGLRIKKISGIVCRRHGFRLLGQFCCSYQLERKNIRYSVHETWFSFVRTVLL